MKCIEKFDPILLFSMYMQGTGVPYLRPAKDGETKLIGKTLGFRRIKELLLQKNLF